MLPPGYVTINQNFSPIPQIYIPNTTILLKRISGKFPNFSEKLTLCAKLGQKLSFWDFELLPPDYVTINQNLIPIPQIYIPNTTILTEKNFWKISQFFRKTYIVCKIATRIENLVLDRPTIGLVPHSIPHSMFANSTGLFVFFANFTPIPQIYTHRATNLAEKIFQEISLFSRKIDCLQNWDKNDLAGILKCYPLIISQSIKILVLFHKSTYQTLPF